MKTKHTFAIGIIVALGLCYAIYNAVLFVPAVLSVLSFAHGTLGVGMKKPAIAETEWEYIRVVYLTRDENDNLYPWSWRTQDKEFLERLRAAFPSGGEYRFSSKPSGSRVNRVDIKLSGGQWWSFHYGSANSIKMIDPNYGWSVFFYRHDNSEAFFTTLTNEIMRATGTAINLNTKFRSYEEAEKLGDKCASRFERFFQNNFLRGEAATIF